MKRVQTTKMVCENVANGPHMLIMKVLFNDTGEVVWAIGDDQVCAITKEDCVRNPAIPYNSVLIQEFPYKDNTPESVGEWRSIIEALVQLTVTKHLEHDGLVHIYPQWLPEHAYVHLGKELFEKMSVNCDHIILYDSPRVMKFVPREAKG